MTRLLTLDCTFTLSFSWSLHSPLMFAKAGWHVSMFEERLCPCICHSLAWSAAQQNQDLSHHATHWRNIRLCAPRLQLEFQNITSCELQATWLQYGGLILRTAPYRNIQNASLWAEVNMRHFSEAYSSGSRNATIPRQRNWRWVFWPKNGKGMSKYPAWRVHYLQTQDIAKKWIWAITTLWWLVPKKVSWFSSRGSVTLQKSRNRRHYWATREHLRWCTRSQLGWH